MTNHGTLLATAAALAASTLPAAAIRSRSGTLGRAAWSIRSRSSTLRGRADDPGAFVVTGGRGQVLRVEPGHRSRVPLVISAASVAAWDNHLVTAIVSAS
jgi:hypothetical protein